MDDERALALLDERSSTALVLEAGTILARKYRLTRLAGFGGMAQLWVATNEATGAEVCVKVLIPGESDDESVERFRREAYAAARLSHRAIVRIFDLMVLDPSGATNASGKPTALAIVMELLHGETLGDLLMKQQGGLPVETVVDLALPVLSALAHAHRAGVVHRDLKPDNIFLSTDPDGHVIPKVLDFGVSKVAVPDRDARSGRSASPLTLDGVMLGTPSFMSPEQARGSRDVDARSDVFSSGILMYVMLAGKNPFESETFHAVISAILQREPPRLNGVSDALWEVIARALSKDPAARYADANELGNALRGASGRTSRTDSGPQSLERMPVGAGLVPPLGGPSIVTVPPVGNAELGDGSWDRAEPSARAASRRRAVRIFTAVTAAALLFTVVALLRGPLGAAGATTTTMEAPSPQGTATQAPTTATTATTATGAAAETLSAPALSTTAATAATTTMLATTATGTPASERPDAGPRARPRQMAVPRAPATVVKTPYDESPPSKEPSIVRDPGF